MYLTAYFRTIPRRIEDLRIPHLPEQEHPYVVSRRILLNHINYENFVTDLLADRSFLSGEPVFDDTVYHCLLIQCENASDGVLAVPDGQNHIRLAAYFPGGRK